MSNPDSFIDEVNEEVRRDRLFAAFRKYGWLGVVLVGLIVGGAAVNEWRKAEARARAQAFGDALLDAQDLGEPAARAAAITAAPADGEQAAVKWLLLAADPKTDRAGALAALESLIADAAQPQIYRDLAVLRHAMLTGADTPIAERRAALEAIAVPGRPFRTLALEQQAYLLIEEGKPQDAITALAGLLQDQESPVGLRRRAAQMIVALGGTLPTAPSAG